VKDYPSIPHSAGQKLREIPGAHVFDKLDGSSMRSEWSRKQGWYKHGRRHGLLDDSNAHLTVVPKLFEETLALALERVARNMRWKFLVVFYELWGAKSFAGLHEPGDPKFLTLFDAAPDKSGFLSPADFRRAFEGEVSTARYLGHVNWTRGYVESVRKGEIEGITFEGAVAKAGAGHDVVRAKAKTQKWIDRVLEVHGIENGQRIIES